MARPIANSAETCGVHDAGGREIAPNPYTLPSPLLPFIPTIASDPGARRAWKIEMSGDVHLGGHVQRIERALVYMDMASMYMQNLQTDTYVGEHVTRRQRCGVRVDGGAVLSLARALLQTSFDLHVHCFEPLPQTDRSGRSSSRTQWMTPATNKTTCTNIQHGDGDGGVQVLFPSGHRAGFRADGPRPERCDGTPELSQNVDRVTRELERRQRCAQSLRLRLSAERETRAILLLMVCMTGEGGASVRRLRPHKPRATSAACSLDARVRPIYGSPVYSGVVCHIGENKRKTVIQSSILHKLSINFVIERRERLIYFDGSHPVIVNPKTPNIVDERRWRHLHTDERKPMTAAEHTHLSPARCPPCWFKLTRNAPANNIVLINRYIDNIYKNEAKTVAVAIGLVHAANGCSLPPDVQHSNHPCQPCKSARAR
ncbi:hypothetical protein CBL_00233 [Carabus blaptoides fortunei]